MEILVYNHKNKSIKLKFSKCVKDVENSIKVLKHFQKLFDIKILKNTKLNFYFLYKVFSHYKA